MATLLSREVRYGCCCLCFTVQFTSVATPVRRTVPCGVRNVGIGSVPRYVVNYSVMVP